MIKKNEIIVKEISFNLLNFNGTGKDYIVNAYAQDPVESDMYTVEINGIIDDGTITNEVLYYADSSGNLTDDDFVLKDELASFVHNILFIKRKYGIIEEF